MENIAQRDAERNIVSAVLNNTVHPSEIDLNGLEFKTDDFRNIFLASRVLLQESDKIDFLLLSNYLAENKANPTDVTLNPTVLANLALQPVPSDLRPSIKILHLSRARQSLADLGTSLVNWTADTTEPPLQIIEKVNSQLEIVRQSLGQHGTNRQHISNLIEEAKEIYQQLYEGISHNITTGFTALDAITSGGGSGGDVWVIGSPTGTGKSALMLEMARRQSEKGFSSLIFSREMRDIENFKRVHSAVGDVPLWMVKPFMHYKTFEKLHSTLPLVSEQRIWLDSVSSDITVICREIRDAVKNDNIQIVYVDYLQLLEGMKGTRTNRMEEIAYCSKQLKMTAMKANVWIVEIAQYNRLANLSGQAENHSFDGASQIEKDASVILHLELEKAEPINNRPPIWRRGKIKTTKGRNAPLTELPVWYRGEVFSFTDENPMLENINENY